MVDRPHARCFSPLVIPHHADAAEFIDGGGPTVRLYAVNASNGSVSAPSPGDPSITARCASLGVPIAPGSTRAYQVAYRDPNFTFCPEPQGGTWNLSSGLTITW